MIKRDELEILVGLLEQELHNPSLYGCLQAVKEIEDLRDSLKVLIPSKHIPCKVLGRPPSSDAYIVEIDYESFHTYMKEEG